MRELVGIGKEEDISEEDRNQEGRTHKQETSPAGSYAVSQGGGGPGYTEPCAGGAPWYSRGWQ